MREGPARRDSEAALPRRKEQDMKRRLVLLIAVAAALAATVAAGTLSASAERGGKGHRLAGTWIGTVVRPAPLPPVRSVQIFTADGRALESSSEPPGSRSPLYSSWKRIGARLYAVTGVHFIFDPSTGAFAGTRKVNRTIELSPDGETFKAVARVTTYDPNGNVLGQGTATATAQRMHVEPIPDRP
jgi:hypothetical protein